MPETVRPYDLALGESDYPSWQGSPARSLIVCSHPRSGSTLLGEAIHFAGGLGCPLEYLHGGFRPTIAARWGAPDLDSYVAAMHRWRTDPSGMFSIKLFWRDVEEVAYARAPGRFPRPLSAAPEDIGAETYRGYHAILADIAPAPVHISLGRRDVVRQAVSAWIASQTGLWRAIPGVGRREAKAEALYDYDRILGLVAFARDSADHWIGYFTANGIDPYRVSYEDLVRDYAGTVGALLAMLGKPDAAPPQRMQRQSDRAGEAMVLRFLRDYAARNQGS
jgi:LPS sulfotransferase NodH